MVIFSYVTEQKRRIVKFMKSVNKIQHEENRITGDEGIIYNRECIIIKGNHY